MSYEYTQLQIDQTLDQLESLAYSYADETVGLGLWDEDYDSTLDGGSHDFDYPAQIAGMRPLDYEPDTDDYEYQQSTLY